MKGPVSPPDPRPNPGTCSSALGLARATLGEGVRDPAVIAATALLTAIVLSLHATTQFALGAEDLLRAEMASATLGLGAAAVVAVSLFRVGGVEAEVEADREEHGVCGEGGRDAEPQRQVERGLRGALARRPEAVAEGLDLGEPGGDVEASLPEREGELA